MNGDYFSFNLFSREGLKLFSLQMHFYNSQFLAGLAYMLLDNHSSDFEMFLDQFTSISATQQKPNCSEIFYQCFK